MNSKGNKSEISDLLLRKNNTNKSMKKSKKEFKSSIEKGIKSTNKILVGSKIFDMDDSLADKIKSKTLKNELKMNKKWLIDKKKRKKTNLHESDVANAETGESTSMNQIYLNHNKKTTPDRELHQTYVKVKKLRGNMKSSNDSKGVKVEKHPVIENERDQKKMSKPKKKIERMISEVVLPANETDLEFKKKKLGKKTFVKKTEKSEIDDQKNSIDSPSKNSRDSRTVFVGNVPTKFNKKKLLNLFKKKGVVEKMWTRGAKPLSDKISKKIAVVANLLPEEHPPLNVHVLFKTAADANSALELNGVIFEDHRLRVTQSRLKNYDKNKGVFVGNLPLRVKDDELYDMFSKCGDIVTARVVRDSKTGMGKGFGYVNFTWADSVELALQLNEEKLNGRALRVQRLFSDKRMKKLTKNKETQKLKNDLLGKKAKTKKIKDGHAISKSSDKTQKKKKLTSTELKKKVLAKKLANQVKKKFQNRSETG